MTTAATARRGGFLRSNTAGYLNAALAAAGTGLALYDVASGASVLNVSGALMNLAQAPMAAVETADLVHEDLTTDERAAAEARLVRDNEEFGAALAMQHASLDIPDADLPALLAGQADGMELAEHGASWPDPADPTYLLGYEDAAEAARFFAGNNANGAADGYARHVREAQLQQLAQVPQVAAGADLETLAHLTWMYQVGHRRIFKDDVTFAVLDGLEPELAERVLSDAQWPVLESSLLDVASAGRDPARLLSEVADWAAIGDDASPAATLAARMDAIQGAELPSAELPEWLPQPPEPVGEHGFTRKVVREQAARIRERVNQLAREVADTSPVWAQELGDCPVVGPERTRWLHAAGRAAAYREQYKIEAEDPAQPLGAAPMTDPNSISSDGRVQQRAYRIAAAAWETATTVSTDLPAMTAQIDREWLDRWTGDFEAAAAQQHATR